MNKENETNSVDFSVETSAVLEMSEQLRIPSRRDFELRYDSAFEAGQTVTETDLLVAAASVQERLRRLRIEKEETVEAIGRLENDLKRLQDSLSSSVELRDMQNSAERYICSAMAVARRDRSLKGMETRDVVCESKRAKDSDASYSVVLASAVAHEELMIRAISDMDGARCTAQEHAFQARDLAKRAAILLSEPCGSLKAKVEEKES